MTITPSDLAVGQVWRGDDGDRVIRSIVANVVSYQLGDEGHTCSTGTFATSVNVAPKLVLVSPAPIPHPSALGDLYAACKQAADQFAVMLELCPDEVYPNMLSEIATRRAECDSAIRKAGGVA